MENATQRQYGLSMGLPEEDTWVHILSLSTLGCGTFTELLYFSFLCLNWLSCRNGDSSNTSFILLLVGLNESIYVKHFRMIPSALWISRYVPSSYSPSSLFAGSVFANLTLLAKIPLWSQHHYQGALMVICEHVQNGKKFTSPVGIFLAEAE